MRYVREKATCTGCEACAAGCPVDAITMAADAEGFAYPVIDESICTNCGLCERICPVDRAAERPWSAGWAAFTPEERIRGDSSSGGVFTLLAQEMISRRGRVYGASYAPYPVRCVSHGYVEDSPGIAALRGSKYVQSRSLAPRYRMIREDMRAGERQALFSGTPCQVAGLYGLLGQRHEGVLETVDFVCHGVPSPMVFDVYQRELEQSRGATISRLTFRDKRRGWQDFGMGVGFSDGSEYWADQRTDPYLVAFLQNLDLRPSCHRCPFAGKKRQSDLTLADCWGADKVAAELNDDKGLSLVLIGSGQGEAMWRAVSRGLTVKRVEAEALLRDNPCIAGPVPPHPRREAFLRHAARRGTLDTERFLRPPNLLRRAVNKAKRLLSPPPDRG